MAFKNYPLMRFAVNLWLSVGLVGVVIASEFPERECCDPVYPLPAVSASVTPDPPPSSPAASSSFSSVTRPGQVKSGVETFNCLLARQLCFEDPSCSPILETIPRVCGAEIVSCSTVTVTKCQAALRTLQAFPFFKPTCLCKEPLLDQECNSFRNFLFDHPCIFVHKKEKDPYPIDALPTCNYALAVCQKEKICFQLFEDFKTNCKVREGKCLMEDRDSCHEAWTNIRFSPMFGCICPNNHMKKRCDRIFSLVNHNPCIVESQRDFHEKKLRASVTRGGAEMTGSTVSSPAARPTTTTLLTMLTSTSTTTTQTPLRLVTTTTSTTLSTNTVTAAITTSTTRTTPTAPPTPPPVTFTTQTTTEKTTVATTTTTTQPTTTTEPTTKPPPTESTAAPRYCVVQRPHHMDQYILEGEGKRLYRDEEPDCSEVCQCKEGEVLVCNTVCVTRAPCKTDFAFYNHAAPAYQAYRGRCLCYSGRFICMRPPPDQYNLPQGVFLFVGYSEADETLLKPLIQLEVQDAAIHLQGLLLHLRPKSTCMLSLFSITMENIILVAKLADSNSSLTRNLHQQTNYNLLLKEKEECVGVLQEISDRINSRDSLVHSHLLLSIFKMAEVEVVYPVASSCPGTHYTVSLNLVIVSVVSLLCNTYMYTHMFSMYLIIIS
ncbi:uncharacterized protein LOC142322676 [Lycorma delicatula]|uniref:uncharacterized protein LOC142322676 n=1 Tax=Lycorma delicatula TaxID=130591 RepID=UPI003F50DEF9